MMNLLRQLPPWLLLVLCALYLLSPADLFPDFLGLPGRVDDILVALGTLFYLYTNSKKVPGSDRSRKAGNTRRGRGEERRKSEGASPGTGGRESEDPYEILGTNPGEDLHAIRRRYKEKLLQYHPDRVHHLGEEFQEMAERKTKQITEAYQRILRERGAGS